MPGAPPAHGLGFSLRITASVDLPAMRAFIEKALGCTLEPGEWNHMSFLMAELLGMRILFGKTRGIGGVPTFQLHGITEVPIEAIADYDGPEIVHIDRVVIDLLQRSGAGVWHEPTIEEIRAEAAIET